MTMDRSFKGALEELIEAPDGTLEEVVAYSEDRLDPRTRQLTEERLRSDPEAAEVLADLEAFEAEAESGRERASELEVEAVLREIGRRSPAAGTSITRPEIGRLVWAMAALLALSIGLMAWLHQTRQELLELRAKSGEWETGAEIHDLFAVAELRGEERLEPITIRPRAEAQTLILTLDAVVEKGVPLDLQVLDARGGVLFSGQAISGDRGVITLGLRRSAMPRGNYRIEVRKPSAPGEPLAVIEFEWLPVADP